MTRPTARRQPAGSLLPLCELWPPEAGWSLDGAAGGGWCDVRLAAVLDRDEFAVGAGVVGPVAGGFDAAAHGGIQPAEGGPTMRTTNTLDAPTGASIHDPLLASKLTSLQQTQCDSLCLSLPPHRRRAPRCQSPTKPPRPTPIGGFRLRGCPRGKRSEPGEPEAIQPADSSRRVAFEAEGVPSPAELFLRRHRDRQSTSADGRVVNGQDPRQALPVVSAGPVHYLHRDTPNLPSWSPCHSGRPRTLGACRCVGCLTKTGAG